MAAALWSLRSAVHAKLTAAPSLTALISGVYAKVPDSTPEPYVTVGPINQLPDDDHGEDGAACEIYVHIWSRQNGYSEAGAIFAEVDAALHRQPLAVPGWTKISVALRTASEEADPDPDIRHTLAIYRVWMTKEGA